ncbi:hypothetical protein DL768_009284 [Monosporascus sp. mg162]|nr:hypothetical protein DL768_009284 [Monosporascus sp. mg162]
MTERAMTEEVMAEIAMTKRAITLQVITELSMTRLAMARPAMIEQAIEPAIEQMAEMAIAERDMANQAMVEKAIQKAMELTMTERAMVKHPSSKQTCCRVPLNSSLGHFDKDKLEEFITKMNQYGMSRRIFGTDHSLGFGPMELEDWDEVWILEGARVPFILRPVDNHYKLVGACYIHEASHTTDRCSVCSYQTVRKEITLRQEPHLEHRAQPATRFMAQRQNARQERSFTLALPGRLEEIEIR